MTKLSSFDPELLEASADNALEAAQKAGSSVPGLVDAWVKAGNAGAVAEVAENGTGLARKAARRGLNVLKSRKVTIPERRKGKAKAGADSELQWDAWMMSPDAAGVRCFIIARRAQAGRYKAVFVYLRDNAGIYRVDTKELAQSALKKSFSGLLAGATYRPVPVPVEWAKARVQEARKAHEKQGTPEPMGLAMAQDVLEPAPAELPGHPFDDEGFELGDEDAKELATKSAELHNLPEFQAWFPAKTFVDEMLMKVGQTLRPGEEPDPNFLRGRIDEEIVAATDRYWIPQRRDDLLSSMKDAAWSVFKRDGEGKALELAAAMKMIAARGLITDPPHEMPFLLGFFQKAVSALAAQNDGALQIPIPQLPVNAELSGDEEASDAGPGPLVFDPETMMGGDANDDDDDDDDDDVELPPIPGESPAPAED